MFRSSEGREGHRLLHSTMPPPHTIGVFLVTVLGIVDQEVYTRGKDVARRPLASQGKPQYPEGWLVVAEIGKRSLRRRNSVADGRTGVADQSGSNMKLANVKITTRYFVEEQTTRQFPQPHGKERGREVTHQAFLKAEGGTRRSPDVDFSRGVIQGSKEPQSLEMIHMEVG